MNFLNDPQYQGSQRALAPLSVRYLPISTTRLRACAVLRRGFLVEPFCGSAALSIATVRKCPIYKWRPFGNFKQARLLAWARHCARQTNNPACA
jgi:hypothetical protein